MTTLRTALKEYLTLRRSLGFKLRDAGAALPDFVRFMVRHHAPSITSPLAVAWAQQLSAVQPATWARRLSFVRGFAQYRSATDRRTEIPPLTLLPHRPQRVHPHLYSAEEIRALLRATQALSGWAKLRPWTYYCFFGLLSVTGLRLGEARNLALADVDLTRAVLTIRGTKFGKSRLVPLHRSTCRVLSEYLARRSRYWRGRAVSPYVFVTARGNRLDFGDIHQTFYRVSRQIGLRGPTDRRGPRLHDLRHRFAVMTLLRWYRAGHDPERRLPILSTYLGHVHVSDTFWYLSAWPELMQAARQRLEASWEHRR
jgi:integrase/recombinase XerD